ncbi:MAG: osmoprotectant NAGGN system M42 family peptidase [Alphaproteobacteria bacterium]|nr:osmoprotectant NAGGN system M42 family peptidase [Alphaproteobacteria bacterium]
MGRLTIDTDYLAAKLSELLAIPSPTGYTDSIVRETCAELERLGVPFELTRRGAIRASRKGVKHKPARAIISHLDTLGAMVKLLKPNGRLEVVPIGHWSARFAEGARCTIFSEAGTYRGTILPLKASGHTFNEEIDTQGVGWDHVELRVDALSRAADDLERLKIQIGDIIAIDPQPEFLDNGFINSRHLDNKAGVAVMLAALEALCREEPELPVDVLWLFTISEEVGQGASSILTHDVASMVTIDNGTTAPGQNSSEFGVTIAMADQTGPFDWHLTKKLVELARTNEILHRKDVFRYYRSDSASAIAAGADVRTALLAFGIDASHGYERIHMHALRSLAELVTAYVTSPVQIERDAKDIAGLKGFTTQPTDEAGETVPQGRGLEWEASGTQPQAPISSRRT